MARDVASCSYSIPYHMPSLYRPITGHLHDVQRASTAGCVMIELGLIAGTNLDGIGVARNLCWGLTTAAAPGADCNFAAPKVARCPMSP